MTDLSNTIAPKSDQLNADDLIAGPKIITVTRVSACPGSAEQPIAIYFEGDNGKPYKPCKSMRRVLVHVWGKDGASYVGRAMTLYRDQHVQFGGVAVGGIRISHMSHIEKPMTMALTATRASRKPYTVEPLAMPLVDGEKSAEVPMPDRINRLRGAIAKAATIEKLQSVWERSEEMRMDLSKIEPGAAHALKTEYLEKLKTLRGES